MNRASSRSCPFLRKPSAASLVVTTGMPEAKPNNTSVTISCKKTMKRELPSTKPRRKKARRARGLCPQCRAGQQRRTKCAQQLCCKIALQHVTMQPHNTTVLVSEQKPAALPRATRALRSRCENPSLKTVTQTQIPAAYCLSAGKTLSNSHRTPSLLWSHLWRASNNMTQSRTCTFLALAPSRSAQKAPNQTGLSAEKTRFRV